MGEFEWHWLQWGAGVVWAIILPAIGIWIFWRDEARYGRG